MEEPQDSTTSGNDRSQKTAETLRALRSLAENTLGNQRRRLSTIESTLNVQLQQIAEELDQDHTGSDIDVLAFQQQSEELSRCQQALSRIEAENDSLHKQLAISSGLQDDQQRQQIVEEVRQLHTALSAADEETASLRQQLARLSEERESTIALATEQLKQLQADCEREDEEHNQLVAELEKSHSSLTAAETELQSLRDQLSKEATERDNLNAAQLEELANLQQQCQDGSCEIDRLTHELEQAREQADQATYERDCLSEELQATQTNLEEVKSLECEQCLATQQQVLEFEQRHSEAESQRQSLEQQLAELEESRNQTQQALEAAEANREQSDNSNQETEQRLQELERTLEQHQAESDAQRQYLEQQLAELEESRNQTQQALEAAEASCEETKASLQEAEQRLFELPKLSDDSNANEELQQIKQQFELALADLEKLKQEKSQLSEKLAKQPEPDSQQSLELEDLRTERDALASRVAELESAPPANESGESQQEMDDLQRRFEMTLEDLRELKKENEELRTQTAATATSAEPSVDIDGLDWQAQRARLMAELDAEEGGTPITPERQQEIATIQGTIAVTDRKVAEKDQEIAELKNQLQAVAEVKEPSKEDVQRAALEELFDQDELIQAERKRLEAVQQEWQEKLRTAELEISVQRATLARERASIEEKLSRLEEHVPEVNAENAAKPRHRWLSALGLKDDDKE